MPIMTRMRDSMPTILFLLLIAFVITLVFDWGMDYMGIRSSTPDVVGTINGKDISYREFSDMLREYAENQKATTGKEPDDAQMKQARDQVWQSIVNRVLLEEQIRNLGISISDQEIIDWVKGENPPEDLRRNFVDSTGQFRRDIYEQFLADPNQFLKDPSGADPAFGTKWLINYEQYLRDRRAQERLQSIVTASVKVSEGDVLQRYRDQNLKYEMMFAGFDAGRLVPDSLVQVTDDDIRAYYNDHLEQQKVEASRKLKYVLFRELPSQQDSADALMQAEDILKRAKEGEDFLTLVSMYDERPDSGTYFKHGEMVPTLETVVFGAEAGDVVGPVLERDGYHVVKILEERKADEVFVHASHILLTQESAPDSNAVKTLAQSVARMAREGKNFGELARQYSKDPGSASRDGDLGWFGKGRMVKSFEDAAFGARPGQIVGPIRTQFGWHILKVLGRDSREVKAVEILLPIRPSSQTRTDIFERARDFAYNAGKADFATEAQGLGLEVKEASVKQKGGVIPGLGVNELAVRWAFDNGLGDVSEPYSVSNGYAVFTIVEEKDAGVRPFDEAKESLRPAALRQMKIKRTLAMAEEYRGKLAPGDSLTILKNLNPSINVQRAGPVTLTGAIPGVGRDQNVIGTVAAMPVGTISHPVEGRNGAYLIHLLSRSEFDSTAYQTQRSAIRAQLQQERKGKAFNEWLTKLKERADIEDNRDMFFR
jgi:parvulin-like peptidyl-prolyl isomerase